MWNGFLGVFLILGLATSMNAGAQTLSPKSIKTGFGLGFNEGSPEMGLGGLVSFGFQKSYLNDRFRLNPNITAGSFVPLGITDVRDQYYRITSFGLNGYFDIIKRQEVSLFIGLGGFVNYSRGLLGTGGEPEFNNNNSEYFFRFYYGGFANIGIRLNPKSSRFAYEISPVNIQFGNKYYITYYFKFGIDILLYQKTTNSNEN